jgi:hypothetical protein
MVSYCHMLHHLLSKWCCCAVIDQAEWCEVRTVCAFFSC